MAPCPEGGNKGICYPEVDRDTSVDITWPPFYVSAAQLTLGAELQLPGDFFNEA